MGGYVSMGFLKKLFGNYSSKELKKIEPIKQKVIDLEGKYKAMSESELRAQTDELKKRLLNGETLDDILPDAFAVCREASDRVLNMRHFPVQILGGIILHQGRIAEMKTGEGKTLVATLPVYLNALTGEGVHVVTVNDYLAKRDSEQMGKIYKYLGLTVGLIMHGIGKEDRQIAYNSDITYGTNNEFGFDYLRDNMVTYKEQRSQRGHVYAIVDEVDSILIDEARTPLIISGQGDKSTELYDIANRFVKTLKMIKVVELNSKEDNDEKYDADYIVDEKGRTATLSPTGVAKAEKFFNIENLMDPENSTVLHHINQAIKANGVMQRDIDYVVRDDEVVIVDEFTGRLMQGRRYSEGLHQAIEAKESVKVARESKTLATITFQNYFRLYKKLGGMTGTALTEEDEFREIYGLDCIEIPTNMPLVRKDHPDLVFRGEKGKYKAIVEKVIECNEKGQPILVGTVSIEKSEIISDMLKKRGIKHEVLNAKIHDKEASIVAQAGKYGVVTIATNMAGRGTDIVLGGNAEYLATNEMRKRGYDDELIIEATGHSETDNEEILEARQTFKEFNEKYKKEIAIEADKVKQAGGLFILGTERHEARRIDNQLRGRSGRQGDVGESQFLLSMEDDLMRLFGGERAKSVLDTVGFDDDMALDSKMLTNLIESAQSTMEGRNFATRKNVLKFDDVVNKQREIIYGQRNMVLEGQDMKDYLDKMVKETIPDIVGNYVGDEANKEDWNIAGLKDYYMNWLTKESDFEDIEDLSKDSIIETLIERSEDKLKEKEEKYGEKIMRELERVILLQNVDRHWMDHIDAMDELKKGIYLRSYGNHDPVVEYRLEGFDMFDEMVAAIREDTVRMLLLAEIRMQEEPKRKQVANPVTTSGGDSGMSKQPIKSGKKVGRNDPCPCGSGKKFKNCHGKN